MQEMCLSSLLRAFMVQFMTLPMPAEGASEKVSVALTDEIFMHSTEENLTFVIYNGKTL